MFPPWTPFFCCSSRSGINMGSRPGKPASAHELLPTVERGESQDHGIKTTEVTSGLIDARPGPQFCSWDASCSKAGGAGLAPAGAQAQVRTRAPVKKGARGGNMVSPALNDHELRIPQLAVGRQSVPPPQGAGPCLPFTLFWRAVRENQRALIENSPFDQLQNGQVPLQLPFGELDPVLVPFLPLELHVAVEDMRTERLAG
jgi:hypothetical protein